MNTTLMAEHPVPVSKLEKVLWRQGGITKADYIKYLIAVAPSMLVHLRDRPLTTVRFPNGIDAHSFYQKNAPKNTPAWVRLYEDAPSDNVRPTRYILANDTSTLIWLGNQASIEFHPWYSTVHRPNEPSHIAFDLDPSLFVWEHVVEVALFLDQLLRTLELPSYPKTSGATGIQVFVPLSPGFTYEDTRLVIRFIAAYVEKSLPKLVTLERKVQARGDKLYFDFLQHAPRKTLVAPYSPRPVPHATVSAPLRWDEVRNCVRPEQFTIKTMPDRLKRLGDLFAPVAMGNVDIRPLLAFIKARRNS